MHEQGMSETSNRMREAHALLSCLGWWCQHSPTQDWLNHMSSGSNMHHNGMLANLYRATNKTERNPP
jgi:hypothetical protein